ncbi:hypothetical protein J4475_02545 [Candidatus Woesearchaeota archaeon]|nr:hypothetical protein [Candidatus Woesearchaeota archaeon]
MVSFNDIFVSLESMGVADSLLPFFLIFIIVFSVFQRTNILGENKKNMNVLVGIIIALMVVIPHVTGAYPPGQDVVNIINNAVPNVSVVLVAILMLMLIIGLFAGQVNFAGNTIAGWMALVSFIIIGVIFGNAANFWQMPVFFGFLSDPETQSLVIVILTFGVVLWWITRDTTASKRGSAMGNIMNAFKEITGGK